MTEKYLGLVACVARVEVEPILFVYSNKSAKTFPIFKEAKVLPLRLPVILAKQAILF